MMTESLQELKSHPYRTNLPAIAVSNGSPSNPTFLYTIPWTDLEESAQVINSILMQIMETNGSYTGVSNRVYLPNGQILERVHSELRCEGQGCAIHHPSRHHMIKMSQHYDDKKGYMQRICEHGVPHPDFDDTKYFSTQDSGPDLTHGCDGCCHKPRAPQKKKSLDS